MPSPKLQDIESEIQNVLAVADELPEDQQPEALSYLDALAIQEQDKCDGIVAALRKRDSDIEFLKQEEKRLRSRRQAMEKRKEQFRDYLRGVMEDHGIQKLSGRKGTLSLREGKSVLIYDPSQLPDDCQEMRVEYKLKKDDIKKRLEAGEEVPGARLVSKKLLNMR